MLEGMHQGIRFVAMQDRVMRIFLIRWWYQQLYPVHRKKISSCAAHWRYCRIVRSRKLRSFRQQSALVRSCSPRYLLVAQMMGADRILSCSSFWFLFWDDHYSSGDRVYLQDAPLKRILRQFTRAILRDRDMKVVSFTTTKTSLQLLTSHIRPTLRTHFSTLQFLIHTSPHSVYTTYLVFQHSLYDLKLHYFYTPTHYQFHPWTDTQIESAVVDTNGLGQHNSSSIHWVTPFTTV